MKTKDFREQVKLALAIFFGSILLISIVLAFFTRHDSTNPVPDFKELTAEEATELADDNDVRVQIVDSVYNQMHKPGTIVDQLPKAGTPVKKDRSVFLVINAINPEKVDMPNIVGVSLRQAIAILESNGLQVGHLSYVPDIATNIVVSQRFNGKPLNPGRSVLKNSKIDLILGLAGSEASELPDVEGMNLRDARKALAEANLNIGKVKYNADVKDAIDSISAIIYKQKPKAEKGAYASMGASVDLWLKLSAPKKDKNEDTK